MNAMQTRLLAVTLLGGSLLATGCKSSAPAPAQNANGTTTAPNGAAAVPGQAQPQPMGVHNPDGSITNPDGSVTYPAGVKLPTQSTAPVAVAPRPSDRERDQSAPQASRSIPAGTPVTVRLNGGLAASRNNVGDRWSGTLEHALISGGETIFPRGTEVSGTVVAAKGRGRFKGAGDLGIELTSIGRQQVRSSEYEQVAKGRGKRTAEFAGGGGGLGAIIGGIAGGGKGALIGGLTGAGAGTAAGAYTGQRDVVMPAESVITFRLTDSVRR